MVGTGARAAPTLEGPKVTHAHSLRLGRSR